MPRGNPKPQTVATEKYVEKACQYMMLQAFLKRFRRMR